jgi:hypothetical protein
MYHHMAKFYNSDRKEPLDLEDHIIVCEDPEVLNVALSKLDAQGWSIEGKICSITWQRLRAKMSVSKERFLEISLTGRGGGPDPIQEIQ